MIWQWRRQWRKILEWAKDSNLHLILRLKDKHNFLSRRWCKVYNPDFYWVSNNLQMRPLASSQTVIPDFTHSPHHPVVKEINVQIATVKSTSRSHWNFNRTNWPEYTKELDACVRFIVPKANNYHGFVELVFFIAKKLYPVVFKRVHPRLEQK